VGFEGSIKLNKEHANKKRKEKKRKKGGQYFYVNVMTYSVHEWV